MYCEKCHTIFSAARCPSCRGKRVREVQPDDLCLLTEKDQIWGGMLSDVLRQHEIPFITRNRMGAGLAMMLGSLLESIRFYVPYSHLSQARELADELFTENADEQ